MMRSIHSLVLSLVFFFPGYLKAHQDTVLKLEEGKIIGLPEEYSPATFDFKTQTLKIAGKVCVFPANLKNLFQQPTNLAEIDPFDVNAKITTDVPKFGYAFSASWYHDKIDGGLPSYMQIRVEPPNCSYAFEILIDLDGVKLLNAAITTEAVGYLSLDIERVQGEPKQGEQSVPPKSDRAGG